MGSLLKCAIKMSNNNGVGRMRENMIIYDYYL